MCYGVEDSTDLREADRGRPEADLTRRASDTSAGMQARQGPTYAPGIGAECGLRTGDRELVSKLMIGDEALVAYDRDWNNLLDDQGRVDAASSNKAFDLLKCEGPKNHTLAE